MDASVFLILEIQMFQCRRLLRNRRYAPRLMKAGTPDGSGLKYLNASILFVSNNFPPMLIFQ